MACDCVLCRVCQDCERMREALADAHARIERLERMVVWAVKHGAEVEGDRMWWFRMLGEDSGDVSADCDGTPASILAAVQQAMKAGAKEGE